ncbi:hypothetical protein ASPTUDRAFT_36785 [Aspergillus tubingensis CBS 134.48]|uniref:Uncharacterized protein n=1 Tax=Aspergillus tubingensis (strain CBS 134.48) TaxID=767770 RepID=A0A1L9NLP5_ASPTC|nr:hypothetical protein ASPTUDRAFT_36785 [Aspergillus tubingensis CBS 134.48]
MDGVSDVRDLIATVPSQTARSGIQASEIAVLIPFSTRLTDLLLRCTLIRARE